MYGYPVDPAAYLGHLDGYAAGSGHRGALVTSVYRFWCEQARANDLLCRPVGSKKETPAQGGRPWVIVAGVLFSSVSSKALSTTPYATTLEPSIRPWALLSGRTTCGRVCGCHPSLFGESWSTTRHPVRDISISSLDPLRSHTELTAFGSA